MGRVIFISVATYSGLGLALYMKPISCLTPQLGFSIEH